MVIVLSWLWLMHFLTPIFFSFSGSMCALAKSSSQILLFLVVGAADRNSNNFNFMFSLDLKILQSRS